MSRIVIVVPCYNEAKRLDVRSFQECAAAMPEVRFLFVNDGSTDSTAAVLNSLRLVAPRSFAVLQLHANMGKAEAVRTGILAALAQDAEHVGYWDADLATPLCALPAFCTLLAERKEVDIVLGSRVRLLGRQIERKATRHYLGRVFATVASLALGFAVYDTQCGAKLFRASNQIRQAFAVPFHSRWIFDVEILARLISLRREAGLTPLCQAVCELPLMEWRDVEGSKVRPKDFAAAMLDLVVIYWTYLRTVGFSGRQPSGRTRLAPATATSSSQAPVRAMQAAQDEFPHVEEQI